ncbi:outer membrane protein OmpA-like peptidoglycan-associated protein [Collimonas sp. PA-H2]|uniref:OmpA family protein n=1 Tax=Collimonas sp. PA-H2 TaxID=1881062 RepID=UPI000BF48976|nr:OmpA family protein [Collimonas sp. PA-H2]PFH08055.1 outer membrane protein OmpA-like peptidoglycan-associated protein [Collimonas sp. PA-H2]
MVEQARTAVLRTAMKSLLLSTATMGIFLLGGCTGSGLLGMQREPANLAAPQDGDFPNPGSSILRQGTVPTTEALRLMRTGMDKDEVRQLLGTPHFSEGVFGVREWNYLFHLRGSKETEDVVCQYMVRFDSSVRVSGLYWRNPDCALLVEPPPVEAVQAMAAMTPQKLTLSADSLFGVEGKGLKDMPPEGRLRIERLANDIKRNFRRIYYVVVTGHTDRLGAEADKMALSLARADAVSKLLAQQGINAKVIRVAGMGDRQPLAQCPGTAKTAVLQDCLRSNRRIEIEVVGEE